MMQIPVQLRPSSFEGLGIFALRNILKGTLVWEYEEPMDVRIRGGCRRSEAFQTYIDHYGYRPQGADYIELCGDLANFFNHDDQPNCGAVDDSGRVYALRDIERGDELTKDYRTFNTLPMPWMKKVK